MPTEKMQSCQQRYEFHFHSLRYSIMEKCEYSHLKELSGLNVFVMEYVAGVCIGRPLPWMTLSVIATLISSLDYSRYGAEAGCLFFSFLLLILFTSMFLL